MLDFNEIATNEGKKQKGANQGKIGEFCFATMTSGVRAPSGPPSNRLIQNNLNKTWGGELGRSIQPWGQDSENYGKRPEHSGLAITTAVRAEHLEFLCPFLAHWTQR